MSLALAKILALVGVGCGLVVPTTILSRKGKWNSTKVFLIARSENDVFRLYVKENEFEIEGEDPKKIRTELELIAYYKGKRVPKEWMLCSPEKNTNKYFLLKNTTQNYHTSWKTMDENGKICEALWNNEGLGEPLTVKLEKENEVDIPKSIYLQHCQIKDLRAESNQDINANKPSLELTCSTDEWKRDNKTIKLLDQGFIYI